MTAQDLYSERAVKEDAALRVISLQKLIDGDAKTSDELLRACTDLGFFYLDCREVASGRIIEEVQSIRRVMLFEHPISKIKDPATFAGPEVIAKQLGPLKQAISSHREICILLLTRLSAALGLGEKSAYQQYHRANAVCPTAMGLLKYTLAEVEPDKVGQIAHTDAGSLSVVFTEVAGLQVLKPNEEEWYWIPPKPGHAVVNVGDSLRFISGGVLASSLHRIIPHKDEKCRHKYSIVYLLRPEMDAEFVDEDGVVWKGLEWTNKKHAVFRASAEEQAKGTYLTGRDGYVGYWDPEKDQESRTILVE
ncbi:gibberellin 20-oxidase [Pseudomassariella vexata]|uniref:Gibberellin 20-oxidase n=1 Tax=Pseudomassariella vexata TaxID=1141098 RepID=A0A1Y2E3X4_9PEZI|nr:gibberellin 20-oxidase [Pseudomassariella vexata]ORY66219.1 gibberellin 20-oxidase [Pseudomassariella vexata]